MSGAVDTEMAPVNTSSDNQNDFNVRSKEEEDAGALNGVIRDPAKEARDADRQKKKAKRPSKGLEGGSGDDVTALLDEVSGTAAASGGSAAALKSRHSRKPRNGKGRGLPKKGGAGGKGVWGAPGCELDAEDGRGDVNDPNYDSESEEVRLKPVSPEVTAEELEKVVLPLVQEFFEHGDPDDICDALGELNLGDQVLRKPRLPDQDNEAVDEEVACARYWQDHHLAANDSIIVTLFHGVFRSHIACLGCGHRSITFSPLVYLQLPVPDRARSCTLHECIREFSKEEKLTGDARYGCEKCRRKQDASKAMRVFKLPRILVIHLSRFRYGYDIPRKVQTFVEFPISLDMAPYAAGENSRSVYSLYAVVNHYGAAHGGHYTAYCKNACNGRWYKYDDQSVSELGEKDTKSSAAYILFYTSIPMAPP